MTPKQWAKKQLLTELKELLHIGFACNVQYWSKDGSKKRCAKLCAARRREALRLLRTAVLAVELS